jgi:hypothetical protein
LCPTELNNGYHVSLILDKQEVLALFPPQNVFYILYNCVRYVPFETDVFFGNFIGHIKSKLQECNMFKKKKIMENSILPIPLESTIFPSSSKTTWNHGPIGANRLVIPPILQ